MLDPEVSFEERLRGAMPRLDPPPGFARRAAARAVAETRFRRLHPRIPAWRSRWALAAVIAVSVIAAFVGWRVQQARRQRAQIEAAAGQLQFAVQFTLNRIETINRRALAGALRSLPDHEPFPEIRD